MGEDPFAQIIHVAARENPRSELGMASHLGLLIGCQRPWLAEDRVRDSDLADVMKDARQPDSLHLVLV
jgi:hypothetical protein